MRRTCRFGVYSSGLWKRCPKKYCCKYDIYHRRIPLETRQESSKRFLHFLGRNFYGKRKVIYNQQCHRKSKKNYWNYENYSSALGKNDLIDLNIEEVETIIALLKREYPEEPYSHIDYKSKFIIILQQYKILNQD